MNKASVLCHKSESPLNFRLADNVAEDLELQAGNVADVLRDPIPTSPDPIPTSQDPIPTFPDPNLRE